MSFSKREFEKQREREAPVQKLDRARTRIKSVAREVQTTEGRLLDYATADEMQRALHATLHDLEQLTLTLAVMERQVKKGGRTEHQAGTTNSKRQGRGIQPSPFFYSSMTPLRRVDEMAALSAGSGVAGRRRP